MAGGLRVAAFVVNMATLCEAFVTTEVRETWASRPGATTAENSR